MNQTQRKFLIDKIEKSAKTQVDALRNSLPEKPNLSNYILHEVMSGKFEIRSNDEIKELIRQKALNAKQGSENWMAATKGSYSAFGNSKDLVFKAYDFFIVPKEYQKLYDEYVAETKSINNKIGDIHIQVDSLITRIQLASDKTLDTMINEVDDMGNISLFDTKLKELTGAHNKLID